MRKLEQKSYLINKETLVGVDVLLEPGDVVYISVAGPQSNFKELGGGLQIELPRWTLPSEKAKRFPNSTIIKL